MTEQHNWTVTGRDELAEALLREHSGDGGEGCGGGPVPRVEGQAYDVAGTLLPVVTSWGWLMAVLAEHYPPDVFTGGSGDPAPQIVALTREVDRLRREAEGAVVVGAAALDGELVDANEQLGLAVTEIGLAAGLPAGTSAAVIRDEVGRLRRLEQLGGQS